MPSTWIPQPVQPSPYMMQVLRKIYPRIDFQRVRFFDGLPWYMRKAAPVAVTLPATFDTSYIHIYFQQYAEKSPYHQSILVHECFHVLQYFDLANAKGIGFFRWFLVCYFAEYINMLIKGVIARNFKDLTYHAYRHHPMEEPAYDIEAKSYQLFVTAQKNLSTPDLPALTTTHANYRWLPALTTIILITPAILLLTLLKTILEIFLLPLLSSIDARNAANTPKKEKHTA